MDNGFVLTKTNPKKSANVLSKLFFLWIIELFKDGVKKSLEVADLFKVLDADSSEKLTDKLAANWNKQLQKTKAPNLLKAICDTFLTNYLYIGVFLFINVVFFKTLQPVVLAYFINLFEGVGNDFKAMYISGGLLVLQTFLSVLTMHHVEWHEHLIGIRIRTSVSSLVYRKLLRLNQKSLGKITAGQLVNLLSNDVGRFENVTIALHFIWIGPIQMLFASYLGFLQVGTSIFAGVLLMACITIPQHAIIARLTYRFRIKIAKRTDHRIKLMNEIVSGIQVIKMYAWEKPFEKLVDFARKKEVNIVAHSSYLRAIFMSSIVFIERGTLFLTILTYYLLGNDIRADIVFSLAQFFNVLQQVMAIYFPMAVVWSTESLVALSRLQEFLHLPEKNKENITINEKIGVDFNHISAAWSNETTLEDFHLHIPKGCLCAVVGPVGAGKSSVLQLILGELPPLSGNLTMGSSLSYSSQEAWLFSSSVRDNILFGREYDQKKYREVVKVCSLSRDFRQLPQGDQTLVGERGVTLSGGQKARINLARAVYKNADLYLLDDPLSAVDAHVGKELFEECILKYLSGKTRVLVTHQLQCLRKADFIIVLNKGRIEAKGSFKELAKSDVDFSKLLLAENDKEEEEKEIRRRSRQISITSRNSHMTEYEEDDEKYEEGKIQLHSAPFKNYVKASGNWWQVSAFIIIVLVSQTICNVTDYWLTFWTQQEDLKKTSFIDYSYNSSFFEQVITSDNTIQTVLKTNITIIIYASLIALVVVLVLARSFFFFILALKSSKNLHYKMFHCLIKAPMRFFNTNPSGRILNRFSKDMGSVDEYLPRAFYDAIQIVSVMSGILVLIVISNYYMLAVVIILGTIFSKLRSWYVVIARKIKHLEGITKSPVFSHVNSSLKGITTIRANDAEKILKQQFDHHQDSHTSACFSTIVTRTSFGLWLDILSVVFIATLIFCFIITTQYSTISGSLVGLAISQALILTGMLQFGMMQTAEVIIHLTSVERVLEYTQLENEEKLYGGKDKPESLWPEFGSIEFKNLSLRYSEYESAVLKHLTFKIEAGSKIGVVGRTGAGKSSLISALFRLAPLEGSILIDATDTSSLNLHELRSRIGIIPQDPVLFSSTIRYNLDPCNEFEDLKLWSVLKQVELKDSIQSLEMEVTEDGGNFSVGQRQLICLARAILKSCKIIVLDEATANVDQKTDAFIQKTIREIFRSCTVITIAHRLNTIMDSDKILVMDAGVVVEFDSPRKLLQKEDGVFRKLSIEAGAACGYLAVINDETGNVISSENSVEK